MFYRQFQSLIAGLDHGKVRYLLVGGMAVIAHGFTRLTQDIDIVLNLDNQHEVLAAIAVLKALEYRPRAPVPIELFADPSKRQEWQRDKDMIAFCLYQEKGGTEVDLFITMPFKFEPAWADRLESDIGDGVIACFVDLERLMEMKRTAGLPQDLVDLRVLKELGDASAGT
jgi:hypothetical protein